MERIDISKHTKEIDNFFVKNKDYLNSCIYLYGGVTERPLKIRINEHVNKHEPDVCDASWTFYQVINAITITNTYTIPLWRDAIKRIENYLINKLGNEYFAKCQNKKNGRVMAQLGGRGAQPNYGDKIEVYLFFKPTPAIFF